MNKRFYKHGCFREPVQTAHPVSITQLPEWKVKVLHISFVPLFLIVRRKKHIQSLPFILGNGTVKAIFYLKLHVFFFFFYTICRFFFVLKNEIL